MSELDLALVRSFGPDALDELARELAPRLAELLVPVFKSDGYLTPSEAARYLGVKPKRIYDLKSMRAIDPDGYDGRTPLFSRATLEAYVRSNTA